MRTVGNEELKERSERTPYTVTFAVLALAGLAYSLLSSLVVPALPFLQHQLHASEGATA